MSLDASLSISQEASLMQEEDRSLPKDSDTLYVGPNAPFKTISAALAVAGENAILDVAPGM